MENVLGICLVWLVAIVASEGMFLIGIRNRVQTNQKHFWVTMVGLITFAIFTFQARDYVYAVTLAGCATLLIISRQMILGEESVPEELPHMRGYSAPRAPRNKYRARY